MNVQKVNAVGELLIRHSSCGYHVHVDNWYMKVYDDFQYNVEGTLVSLKVNTSASLFPCGVFQCGACSQILSMDRKNITFWDEDMNHMVCRACKNQQAVLMFPVVAQLMDIELDGFQCLEDGCMEIYDRRSKGEKLQENVDRHGKILADTIGGTYFQNKTIAEMREYFLAKRVVKRFMEWRQKQRRKYVAHILYEVVGIGLDAALECADRVMIT